MIHPVFRLAAAQPMLLAAHVGAYAELVSEELHTSAAAVQRRLLWQLGGALCLAVAAVLAGVTLGSLRPNPGQKKAPGREAWG